MPEGDTIFRAARHLRQALVGKPVQRFELHDRRGVRKWDRMTKGPDAAASLVGAPVIDVESRGKNLLIHFEAGWVLYTHMKMTGSWHIYRPGEPWRKSPRGCVARIDNLQFVAVCFNAPVVELMTEARALRHPTLSRIGPDLLAEHPKFRDMHARLRRLNELPLGEALLDQRALAGLGNVYKSELCFLERLSPFAPVRALDDARLNALLMAARTLMLQNLGTFRRTTRWAPDRERHWVYGRSGAGCHRCGDTIRLRRQGDAGRSTYYCPRCQDVTGPPLSAPHRGRRLGRPGR